MGDKVPFSINSTIATLKYWMMIR